MYSMRGSRKFFFEGSISDFFPLIRGGDKIQITLKADQHRPTSETLFRWRADDGSSLKADLVALSFSRGSRPVLLRNPKAL